MYMQCNILYILHNIYLQPKFPLFCGLDLVLEGSSVPEEDKLTDSRCFSYFNMEDTNCRDLPKANPKATPPRNKGLIAGLIKGNQWLISP